MAAVGAVAAENEALREENRALVEENRRLGCIIDRLFEDGAAPASRRAKDAPTKKPRRAPATPAAPAEDEEPEQEDSAAPTGAPDPLPLSAIEFNGIQLVTTADEESIGYQGLWTELTASQAAFAEVLLRASPEPVGREFIRDKLWQGATPASWDILLSQRTSDLRQAVKGIGLTVVAVARVGIALQVAA